MTLCVHYLTPRRTGKSLLTSLHAPSVVSLDSYTPDQADCNCVGEWAMIIAVRCVKETAISQSKFNLEYTPTRNGLCVEYSTTDGYRGG